MPPFTTPMMMSLISGTKKAAWMHLSSFVLVTTKAVNTHQITSGQWAIPVHVVHVLKSSLTTVSISGVACQARLKKMVTASLKSGTTFSCSSTVLRMVYYTLFQRLLWIQVWAWSVFLPFYSTSTQTTKLTYSSIYLKLRLKLLVWILQRLKLKLLRKAHQFSILLH